MNVYIQKLINAGINNAEQEYTWLKKYAGSQEEFNAWLEKRIQGKPLAYIIGHVDFYGLNLIVNEHVLIPRPETEMLVELIIDRISINESYNILDLGCGSGAIALAIKNHLPKSNVFGIDYSLKALNIALKNQALYPNKKVNWVQGNWLSAINLNKIDLIISNPPYVESTWHNPALAHEPKEALYSGKAGLDDIQTILRQTDKYKHLDIWFEHGHQHDLSRLIGSSWNIEKFHDHSGSQRFTYLSCNKDHV